MIHENNRTIVNQQHTPKRAEDFSFLTRVASAFMKFNWLFALLVGFFIAAGFGFRTPQAQFQELSDEIKRSRLVTQAKIDSLVARADRQDTSAERLVDILDLFSIDLCLRRQADPYVYRRLKCRELIQQRMP